MGVKKLSWLDEMDLEEMMGKGLKERGEDTGRGKRSWVWRESMEE